LTEDILTYLNGRKDAEQREGFHQSRGEGETKNEIHRARVSSGWRKKTKHTEEKLK